MIEYRSSAEEISCHQLQGFFEGWPASPSTAELLEILKASYAIGLAWDDRLERVVGLITAISDGHLAAYVPLLEVLPSHRGQGIGSSLVNQMKERLDHLYMVDLVCDEHLASFYSRCGFVSGIAMIVRNRNSFV